MLGSAVGMLDVRGGVVWKSMVGSRDREAEYSFDEEFRGGKALDKREAV